MANSTRHVGVPWFRSEDYELLLGLIEDPFRLPAGYAVWEQIASKGYLEMRAAGTTPVKTYIDPLTFLAWCEKNKYPATYDSLVAYADEVAVAVTRH